VWDTSTGKELQSLEGHKNVVYTVAFNLPFGDKIATGSFDKTARVRTSCSCCGGKLSSDAALMPSHFTPTSLAVVGYGNGALLLYF
jgi:dynein assembly factor with WDR repeat domains 1